jgi:uncharacterized membrane protein
VNSTSTASAPAPTVYTTVASSAVAPVGVDHHWRSFVKGVTWRLIGTVDTMVISFFITGKIKWAISIGCVEFFTKICLYYVHERMWEKISFGRRRKH